MNPAIIPDHQKKNFLKSLSEDDFRDKVVRPLFIFKGMRRGKDTCGNDEEGKDCFLYTSDSIRDDILYAIQTKKGDVKMARTASDNLLNALTQLTMALKTPVSDAKRCATAYPDCVLLVASGEINKAAQTHINSQLQDPRIRFLDADDLIADIDKFMPQFWLGIDIQRLPYLRNFRDYLISHSDTIDMTQLGVSSNSASPVTDEAFVQLYFNRQVIAKGGSRSAPKGSIDFEEYSVTQLMQKSFPRVLISGDAGAGKTTTLRRVALLMTDAALQSAADKVLPVILRAIDIARANHPLVQLAAEFTERFSGENKAAFSNDDLIEGHVTLLLDGYDELATDELRDAFVTKLSEFSSAYQSSRIWLTSRDSPYIEMLQEVIPFTRLNISPINIGQAGKIIDRLSRGKDLPTHTTEEILRRLDTVHGIDLSPLLVTVFVATTDYARSDIPANITELFKKFTELMLGRWDQSKGLGQQYQSNVKDFLLTRIAFEMHSKGETSISVADFKTVLNAALTERGLSPQTSTLYDEIVNRSGLLRLTDDELSFRHLLIQEFFAGRGIPSSKFMQDVLGDVWWMRAIVFYFGERPGDESALTVLPQQLADMAGTDLFQAAITVGLAIQACYLTKVNVKLDAMEWVTHSMSITYDSVCEWFADGHTGHQIIPSIYYYMFGRDAAAAQVIGELADRQFAAVRSGSKPLDGYTERMLFWCLAGLLSIGNAEKVAELFSEFKPSDQRLLLSLHVGCAYLDKVQVVDAKQKKSARELAARIRPHISELTKSLIREMKGLLLEVRASKVATIDSDRSHAELEDEYVHGRINDEESTDS